MNVLQGQTHTVIDLLLCVRMLRVQITSGSPNVKVSKAFNIRPSRSGVGLELATYGLREKHLDISPRVVHYFSLIRYWYSVLRSVEPEPAGAGTFWSKPEPV